MRANNPFAGLLTREERDHVLAAGDVAAITGERNFVPSPAELSPPDTRNLSRR